MKRKFDHIANFEVRVGDINYGGHLGNDKALLLFHDARLKFLHLLGHSEKDIGEGKGIIMTEAHVYFKKEAFLYDTLYANIEVGVIEKYAFELKYAIHRETDGQLIMEGSTKQLAFDYEKRKVASLPVEFRQKLSTAPGRRP
jgi:acyl-CoA thioesterase FadM